PSWTPLARTARAMSTRSFTSSHAPVRSAAIWRRCAMAWSRAAVVAWPRTCSATPLPQDSSTRSATSGKPVLASSASSVMRCRRGSVIAASAQTIACGNAATAHPLGGVHAPLAGRLYLADQQRARTACDSHALGCVEAIHVDNGAGLCVVHQLRLRQRAIQLQVVALV